MLPAYSIVDLFFIVTAKIAELFLQLYRNRGGGRRCRMQMIPESGRSYAKVLAEVWPCPEDGPLAGDNCAGFCANKRKNEELYVHLDIWCQNRGVRGMGKLTLWAERYGLFFAISFHRDGDTPVVSLGV